MQIVMIFLVASLVASSASSSENLPANTFTEQFGRRLVEFLMGPQCAPDRPRPEVGVMVPVSVVCESASASTYYLDAVGAGNQFKIDKVMGAACSELNEFGVVDRVLKTLTFPRRSNQKTLYFSSIEFTDDLYGKKLFGLAYGCGSEIPAHREARLLAEKEYRDRRTVGSSADLNPADQDFSSKGIGSGARVEEKAAANALDALTTRITRAWRRPVAFKGGLEVYLRMSLASNGELVDVRIVKTSGDVLYDRSALTAVKRAAPFDEVKQFDAATFEEKFRSLTVKFRPED